MTGTFIAERLLEIGTHLFSLNTLLLGLGTYLTYEYVYHRWISPLRKIPGEWHTYLTGIVYWIHKLKGDGPVYMQQLHRKYGPFVRVGPSRVSVADRQGLRAIHKSHDFLKVKSYNKFDMLGEQNMFSARDLDLYKKRKRLIAPSYSISAIKANEYLIRSAGIDILKHRLRIAARHGEAIDLSLCFMYMSFDVIGELTFGGSFGALENDGHPVINWMKKSTTLRFARFLLGNRIPMMLLPKHVEAANMFVDYAMHALEERKKEENPRNDLLQRLIDAKDDEGNRLSDRAIASEMLIQMIGGTSTTAWTMSWIIHALLDHSEWFDRIYQELISTLEDTPDKVPASSLARLPVLNAVINETNRILPVATEDFERHVPSEGAQLGEYFIPGWCTVTLQMYSLHTDPNLWEDPDKFKPERWLKEHPTDALDEAIPFSRGVRVCIGRNLAMTEIRMLLAMLVYNFTFERVPGDDMTPFHFLSAEPAGQRLRVKVTERVH